MERFTLHFGVPCGADRGNPRLMCTQVPVLIASGNPPDSWEPTRSAGRLAAALHPILTSQPVRCPPPSRSCLKVLFLGSGNGMWESSEGVSGAAM